VKISKNQSKVIKNRVTFHIPKNKFFCQCGIGFANEKSLKIHKILKENKILETEKEIFSDHTYSLKMSKLGFGENTIFQKLHKIKSGIIHLCSNNLNSQKFLEYLTKEKFLRITPECNSKKKIDFWKSASFLISKFWDSNEKLTKFIEKVSQSKNPIYFHQINKLNYIKPFYKILKKIALTNPKLKILTSSHIDFSSKVEADKLFCILKDNSNPDKEIVDEIFENLNLAEKSLVIIFHAVAKTSYLRKEKLGNTADIEKRQVNNVYLLNIIKKFILLFENKSLLSSPLELVKSMACSSKKQTFKELCNQIDRQKLALSEQPLKILNYIFHNFFTLINGLAKKKKFSHCYKHKNRTTIKFRFFNELVKKIVSSQQMSMKISTGLQFPEAIFLKKLRDIAWRTVPNTPLYLPRQCIKEGFYFSNKNLNFSYHSPKLSLHPLIFDIECSKKSSNMISGTQTYIDPCPFPFNKYSKTEKNKKTEQNKIHSLQEKLLSEWIGTEITL